MNALRKIVAGFICFSAMWSVGVSPTTAQEPEVPPMVAKKIFEPPTAAPPKGPAVQGPLPGKTLIVTGIVLTPDAKKAMIVEKGSPRSSGTSTSGPWYRENDGIAGYVVERIHSDRVDLSAGGQKMTVPLFGTVKERPKPVMISRPNAPGGMGGNVKSGQATEKQGEGDNALPKQEGASGASLPPGMAAPTGLKPSVETQPANASALRGFPNPLLEALKKARQQERAEPAYAPPPQSSSR